MNSILFDKWIKSCNFVRMLTFSTYKSSPPPFPPPPLKLKKKKKKNPASLHVQRLIMWIDCQQSRNRRTVLTFLSVNAERSDCRFGSPTVSGRSSRKMVNDVASWRYVEFYNIYWNVIHLFCEVTRRYWTLSRHRTPCVHRSMWTCLIWYLEHINLNYSIFKW